MWANRGSFSDSVLIMETVVRAILGLFNAFCLFSFRNGVAKTFGRTAANWFVVLQASQFHTMYYASRTLPNFFAFGLSMSMHSLYQSTDVLNIVSYIGPP